MDDRKLKRILEDIYRRLFNRYGPQHWWPAEEPFEVIIGAILTQSAAWTNVEKAILNLKNAGKLSPEAIRRLSESELAGLIYSCGYYNTKARKLKSFVKWFGEKYNDSLEKLFQNEIGKMRSELLDIYGIGEETADSIILYAGNKPIFVVDAYTRRIINRVGLTPEKNNYSDYQTLFMKHLPPDAGLFNEYHALLVRLGKETCRTCQLCRNCCLNLLGESGNAPAARYFPCAVLKNSQ
jgi:endonuclease-3 related protein